MGAKKIFYQLSHWETWHYLAKYIPLLPVWLWYCLRARSFWFFTPSNPTLTFGGFEGESKKEMYDQLPTGSYPRTIYITPSNSFELAEAEVIKNDFTYPFAVKPDVGMMGLMFRQIRNVQQFRRYHEVMPTTYIVQELISEPLEVSVFYYRFPGRQTGTITGFLKKEFPEVKGDGHSTLWELMRASPGTTFRLEELKAKHKDHLHHILPPGERYCLSYALNLSRGGRLVSLEKEKDERLVKVFDDLFEYTGSFYYGRFDIRCKSVEALKQGKFCILEYNGCGAEPHHIYGNGNTLLQAYSIVMEHWKVLYEIARYNHCNGHNQWEFWRGYRFLRHAKQHFKQLKKLDKQFQV